MVKEKKIKSVDEGFVSVLKLVEVLRDIVALKLNKYKLVDWYKINHYIKLRQFIWKFLII